MDSNLPISEQYRKLAEQWCDAESAASLLEETKSAILSQKMLTLGDIPVSRAEMQIKGSAPWLDHLNKINDARRAANLLKVNLEYLKMKFFEQNSTEASRRAEMKLT